MTAIKSQHSRVFEQLVAEAREGMVEAMINTTVNEFMREIVGQIRGLDVALKLSEQADFKLSGDDE
jgi:hypothetical protein